MSKPNLAVAATSTRQIALATALALLPAPAQATAFTAGTVMQKMGTEERFAFVAGVVEGLAMSRYLQDGKRPEGMKCIYDWFYEDKQTIETVYAAFERYPDYPPGTIVDVLVRKKCP